MTARDALGFRRMDYPEIGRVANEMYKNDYRLLKNYFKPCFKLKEKLQVGSRYKGIDFDPDQLSSMARNSRFVLRSHLRQYR